MRVADLEKSKEFFQRLGFSFNEQFTDNTAACLVISNEIYAMLLTDDAMRRFTKKELVNAKTSTEVLLALSFDKKEEVDAIFEKVIAAGGSKARETEDLGFMYTRSFEDLDGHIWEPFWMDPKHVM